MKEVFLNNSINLIKKYNAYNETDIEKIRYGLEGIYLTITKLIVILVLSIIFNIFKEIILVLVFLNIIRYPAFGVHADKSSICLITSILLIFGLTLLISKIYISNTIKIILCIICTIDYLIFAPADTIKRPLTNAKKRKYRKIASVILSIVYSIAIFLINTRIVSNTLLISLIIEAIMINPLTYKALKMPYNNYKNC